MKTYRIHSLLIALFLLSMFACGPKKNQRAIDLLKAGIHTVVVQKVMQTSQYTYVLLKDLVNPENIESDSLWAATIFIEANKGDTLYYKGGMPMFNFQSKELNRSFKKIWFLDSLSKKPPIATKESLIGSGHNMMSSEDGKGKPKIQKLDVTVDAVAGGVTIADLYSKKSSFAGKTIKVNAQVTKFSKEIMGKNWLHVQDGTEAGGKFDLTITTDLHTIVNVGDIVCFEGKIAIDKNIGQGYFYEILLEDAKMVK